MRRRVLEPARRLAAELAERGAGGSEVALVAGSGLGALVADLEDAVAIPWAELSELPAGAATVPGHAGRFVAGTRAGRRVLVQEGRLHAYEGRSAFEVTRTVRAMAGLGVRVLVLTNAAGGLRADRPPGTLLRIVDHLNLQGLSPLFPGERGPARVYDPGLGRALDEAARVTGVVLERGTYAGLPGPAYESPAEVRALALLGADAVGMSTVLEAVAAAAAGIAVAAVSCVTNTAAGLAEAPLRHEDVVAAAAAASGRLARLVEAALPSLMP